MKRSMFVAALVMAVAAFSPQRSEAGFKLQLNFGGTITFDLDSNLNAGPTTVTGANGYRFTSVSTETVGNATVVTFGGLRIGDIVNSSSVGLYRFNTLSLASNAPGTIISGILALDYGALTRESTTAANLSVSVTDTDYNKPVSPVNLTTAFSAAQNSVLNTEKSTISTPGGEFDLSGTTLTKTGNGYTESQSTGIFPYAGTYSLTSSITFNSAGTGSGSISTAGSIVSTTAFATPAPAAAFMAMSVLPLIAVALRRRRKDSVTAIAV